MNPQGVRPAGPRLRLDTNSAQYDNPMPPSFSVEITSPKSELPRSQPFTPSYERYASQPPQPAVSPSTETFPQPRTSLASKSHNRGYIGLALDQLQARPMPPPVWDQLRDLQGTDEGKGLNPVAQTMRGVVKLKQSAGKRLEKQTQRRPFLEEDEDEDGDLKGFSTDHTYMLMNKLVIVINEHLEKSLPIFGEGIERDGPGRRGKSSFHRHRQSLQIVGRRSRSPSPNAGGNVEPTDMVSQFIAILASVVSEDCRYQIAAPRPLRPPNALQQLTLDLAMFVVDHHRNDPKIISRVGFAMLPAFSTFPPQMLKRVLEFFEHVVMRKMLEELSYVQGSLDEGIVPTPGLVFPSEPISLSIQVETAEDDPSSRPTWKPWCSPASLDTMALRSTTAPNQQLSVYHLASLTAPLLAAIFENVDITALPLTASQSLNRLLAFIIDAKRDAYLDVLDVMAHYTPKARYGAASMLATYWPHALGHAVIAKLLPVVSFGETLRTFDLPGLVPKGSINPGSLYAHQFVPWRFAKPTRSADFEGAAQGDCRLCARGIDGFGLLCPFCMCAVHFDCYDYPDGCHSFQYEMTNDPDAQKVVVDRFCYVLPTRRNEPMEAVKQGQHAFKLVNLFALQLCFICRLPLWGCTMQGLKCVACKQTVHATCLSKASSEGLPRCRTTKINSSHLTIDWALLRRSFADHYADLLLSQEELEKKTYEEISVFASVLWTQTRLMDHGVALGTVIVNQRKPTTDNTPVEQFELQYLAGIYEHHLASSRPRISLNIDEFLQESGLSSQKGSIMFDWSALVHIASTIKTPHEASEVETSRSSDFLNVASKENLPSATNEQLSSSPQHPYETLSLARLRDVLGYEFNLYSDAAARLFLEHLHHLGFFERQDRRPCLFENVTDVERTYCTFVLPLGLDYSSDVETLVAAVEGCLSDLDLSVNEVGFLLLVRKLWPNGMASDYALRRLARTTLAWIFAEDDSLATILRDYLAQGRTLPGVRSGLETVPWPAQSGRPAPSGSANNGGDYVASRRNLLSKYGARWLLALHDQERTIYADLMYEISEELAEEAFTGENTLNDPFHTEEALKARDAESADRILRFLLKLTQNSVAFTAFDHMFLRWLKFTSSLDLHLASIPSLFRLFNREAEATNRFSTMIDAALASSDAPGSSTIDPWRVIFSVASRTPESLARSLQWLCLFARSGVDISISTYLQFTTLVNQFKMPMDTSGLLVRAALSSTWLKSIGRQELQVMFSQLLDRLAPQIIDHFKSGDRDHVVFALLRQSLGTCLLLYGCERNILTDLDIITEDDVRDLPSRRRLVGRVSTVSDPVVIDNRLIRLLERLIEVNVDEVTCLVGSFVTTFINESPLLEPYEVDNFILRNGQMLCTCAWQLYDIQRHEISAVRTSLLVRTVVVDPQPLQSLLQELFREGVGWEQRFLAVTRLFRIVLDVTSPAFQVEDRQWRPSVADIFFYFFSAMWNDDREEVRLAVETWSQTLLPAHFQAISRCWGEYITKAPIEDRVKLVAFLLQLRPHFPTWKVLSWDVIIETLLEDDYMRNHGRNEDGPASAHLSLYGLTEHDTSQELKPDSDLELLKVSIVALALQMIADGIKVDVFSMLKLKYHLVQILGFEGVSSAPAANGQGLCVTFECDSDHPPDVPELAMPCLAEMVSVLDSFHPFDVHVSVMRQLRPGEEDGAVPLLVGSAFADIYVNLTLYANLAALPVLMIKNILEGLVITIYKHDFDSRPLKALKNHVRQAVAQAMVVLLSDVSYEVRQVALSVAQAFVRRLGSAGMATSHCIEAVAKLVIQSQHNSEDYLVAQARTIITTALTNLSENGLLLQLFKLNLDREFFVVLRHITDTNAKTNPPPSESLRDKLLRDLLPKIVDGDKAAFQTVLSNLHTFFEVVHHQHLSADLMQFIANYIGDIAGRASEFATDEFDPHPLLSIPALLIRHSKARSLEMVGSVETVFRVSLLRFNVTVQSLTSFLRVTSTLYRKNRLQHENTVPPPLNKTDEAFFEVLGNGLRMRARVSSTTLASMVEVLTATESFRAPTFPKVFASSFLEVADAGLQYLHSCQWSDHRTEVDYTTSMSVAKIVLDVVRRDRSIFEKRIYDTGLEKTSRPTLNVRAWNMLLAAALADPSPTLTALLFAYFPTFCASYFGALKNYIQAIAPPPEAASADINHAYAAMRLWLLVAIRVDQREQEQANGVESDDLCARNVWHELWPPYESLVNIFETNARAGHIPALATSTWASVADLFVFVRQAPSALRLETSSQIALLKRLRIAGRAEAPNSKLSRALQSLSEPLTDTPFDLLVGQASKDIIVAEKLHALEARRKELSKAAPERSRRDLRANTRHPTEFSA